MSSLPNKMPLLKKNTRLGFETIGISKRKPSHQVDTTEIWPTMKEVPAPSPVWMLEK
jgi:hypothetical protein